MLHMLISKFNTENVESKIAAFEQEHNFKFPDEYRNFLLKYNGGRTIDTNFRKKVSSDLVGLYSFDEAAGDLYYLKDFVLENVEEHLENGMMLIGTNCFGDDLAIGISEKNNGRVFFFYHDRPPKYIKITDSFKEFVDICKSHEIGRIWTIEERKQILKKNGEEVTPDYLEAWQEEIDFYSGIHQEQVILD